MVKAVPEQADAIDARIAQCLCSRVDDMQERNLQLRFDGRRHAMHGVRAEQHDVRARGLYLQCGIFHARGEFVPALLMLQGLDLFEADRDHHAARVAVAAQPRFHILVDHAVILGR